MNTTIRVLFAALASTPSFSTALAQTLLWSDDFSNPSGWSVAGCQRSYANQQCALSQSFGPTPTNDPLSTYGYVWHAIPISGPVPDGQTLEARVDLVSANQPELWADVAFFSPGGNDYHLFVDVRNGTGLPKGLSWKRVPTRWRLLLPQQTVLHARFPARARDGFFLSNFFGFFSQYPMTGPSVRPKWRSTGSPQTKNQN